MKISVREANETFPKYEKEIQTLEELINIGLDEGCPLIIEMVGNKLDVRLYNGYIE